MMAFKCAKCDHIYGSYTSTCPQCSHPVAKLVNDDDAVKEFAKRMANKLAISAEKGRSGWNGCSERELSAMLRDHVEKGDPIDVANFCMMLSLKGYSIVPIAEKRWPCWSCHRPVSMDQRAQADGHCPACHVELDSEDWPFNEKTIRELRESGHAVIVWTPEEIGEADIDDLESLSIERGHNYLDEFKEIEDDE